MARLMRYTTKWKDGNGTPHTLVYHREQDPADAVLADTRNKPNEEALFEYQAACLAGTASEVKTEVVEVD